MLDVLAVLLAASLLAAHLQLGGALLRRARAPRGRRPAPLRTAHRVAATLFALVITVFAAWRLSRATTWQLLGAPITQISTTEPVIALTFDDGPDPRYLPHVLAVLAAEHVPATFFVIGRELAAHPELGRAIVDGGHQLANHSYTHRRMLGRSLDDLADELARTDAEIRRAGGAAPIAFRPPNGKRLLALPWLLSRLERPTILWDIAPDSADPGIPAPRIVAQVLADAHPGAIVLMHLMVESRASSRAALPGILRALKQHGYRFVTIDQLLALRH